MTGTDASRWMEIQSLARDEQLVAELHRLGVEHLVRLQPELPCAPLLPVDLIAALAAHPQARFRNSLILLFLRRPAYSRFVPAALVRLDLPAATTLRLCYQAAVYLRPELEDELRQHSDDVAPLPDLFSAELGLPALGSLPAGAALDALGDLHHRLSGQAYNWAGSYRQHIPLFLRQLKRHARPRETVPKQK
ncbi:MAG TPA: hypothetical protein VJL59_17405 [Anaerolineales bacterium]|nr:hypothetical protein [Anaerolineales bacterium]